MGGSLHVWESPPERYPHLSLENPYLQGDEIINIQRILALLGYYKGDVDGIFGPQTAQSIEVFRQAAGLKKVPLVDEEFFFALARYYEAKLLPPAEALGQDVEDLFLVVVLGERTLYVMGGGEIQATYPVAIGKVSTPSPVGSWVIANKGIWSPGLGVHWLGLNVPWGNYGIHGTNQPYSIGQAASAGCIRMYNRDIKELYAQVEPGVRVFILRDSFSPPSPIPRRLSSGSGGSDVYLVQKRLRQLGYYDKKPDGVYGWWTQEAVKEMQKDNNLPVTGILEAHQFETLGFFPFE